MGEVYRARDTRLDRTVAIKILSEALAADPQFRERFDREARAISQLDHPHICTLHDVGERNGTAYLVMQYLDGETLADRLKAGPLPLGEALRCAVQIAGALDAAHGAGVVHRDLKPSNIKLTKTGAMLLDFGLAKTSGAILAGSSASMMPTTPPALTQQGSIIGTLQYMAPEQLEGHEADARTDIFAFGAVLYEMLTGQRAFEGRSQAGLVGAILKDSPKAMTSLAPRVPRSLERATMTCLEKRPDDRWQNVRDLRRELTWTVERMEESTPFAEPRRARRVWLPWSVAAAALLIAVAVVVRDLRRAGSTVPSTTRLTATLPQSLPYDVPRPGRSLAISPDGRQLVYSGIDSSAKPGNRRKLFRRSLDQLSVMPIAGTEGGYQPFFAPDGRSVAFFAGSDLKKVSLEGGPSVSLVRGLSNTQWGFGTWRPDGIIVFSTFQHLQQVSADGGSSSPLTTIGEKGGGDLWHHFPVVVPSTGDIIFTVYTSDARVRLDILRWDTKTRSTLVENASASVLTASGHLLFGRDETTFVAAFNASERRASPERPLSESVVTDQFGIAQLAVSPSGTLAYVAEDPAAPVPILGWVSRTGQFTELGALLAGMQQALLSPDGSLALLSSESGAKLAIFEINRRVSTRLNLGSRQTETAAWHPDGKRITLGGSYLSLFDPDTGTETRLTPVGRPKRNASWTPDGRTVAYMTFEPFNDIYTLTMKGNGAEIEDGPRPLRAPAGVKWAPAISPDGRWIAYQAASDPASGRGRTDVYLARFPEGTGRVQVTSAGGANPFWGRKGDELFFVGPPRGELYSVPVTLAGERAQVGVPRTLFDTENLISFSPAADGSRFLAIKQPRLDPTTQIIIVQNWLEELKRIVAAK